MFARFALGVSEEEYRELTFAELNELTNLYDKAELRWDIRIGTLVAAMMRPYLSKGAQQPHPLDFWGWRENDPAKIRADRERAERKRLREKSRDIINQMFFAAREKILNGKEKGRSR
jgi:hypothetical protein